MASGKAMYSIPRYKINSKPARWNSRVKTRIKGGLGWWHVDKLLGTHYTNLFQLGPGLHYNWPGDRVPPRLMPTALSAASVATGAELHRGKKKKIVRVYVWAPTPIKSTLDLKQYTCNGSTSARSQTSSLITYQVEKNNKNPAISIVSFSLSLKISLKISSAKKIRSGLFTPPTNHPNTQP